MFNFLNFRLLAKYACSMVGWIMVSLVIIEISVRVFWGAPALSNINDPDWGRVPAKGSVILYNAEGHGITKYVDDGEISTPFSGGKNIIVLGDSHTEALQVMDAQKYPSITETMLREDGYFFDVRNLGFSGMSIADYIFLAPFVIEKFDPAIVVIQLDGQDFEEAFDITKSNYFVYGNDGKINLIHKPHYYTSVSSAKVRDILNYSSMIVNGFARFQQIFTNNGFLPRSYDEQTVFAKPQIATQSTADPIPLELETLKLAYRNIKLILVYLPYTPVYTSDNIVLDDGRFQDVLLNIKAMDGWSVIDPTEKFAKLLDTSQFPRGFDNSLPGKGHLNQMGHRIVAELLVDQVERLLKAK
jgi:hypothetical protein